MGIEVFEAARQENVEKCVIAGTICVSQVHPGPIQGREPLGGLPGRDQCPCGLQKVLPVQSQAYREEYGFNSIYLLPVNLYGLFSEIMGMKL